MGCYLRHLAVTPTFAFTLGGALLVAADLWGAPYADAAAYIVFTLAGAGTGIALYEEVQRKGEEWGWRGIARSLHRPSRQFVAGFGGHLPQFLIAAALAFYWRRKR